MYYAHTISEIRRVLAGSDAIFSKHLLWMCDEIMAMDRGSAAAAAKAGRWIGWVLANIESMQLWHNNQSRDLIRIDVAAGRDIAVKA